MSGQSASDEDSKAALLSQLHKAWKCEFCHRDSSVNDVCGKLHVDQDRHGNVVAAHQHCMEYSSGLVRFKMDTFGGFNVQDVLKEIKRGRQLKCHLCKVKGRKVNKDGLRVTVATAGCAVKKCDKTFHYYCAKMSDTAITEYIPLIRKHRAAHDKGEKGALYRVFCSTDHKKEFYSKAKEMTPNFEASQEEDIIMFHSLLDSDEESMNDNHSDDCITDDEKEYPSHKMDSGFSVNGEISMKNLEEVSNSLKHSDTETGQVSNKPMSMSAADFRSGLHSIECTDEDSNDSFSLLEPQIPSKDQNSSKSSLSSAGDNRRGNDCTSTERSGSIISSAGDYQHGKYSTFPGRSESKAKGKEQNEDCTSKERNQSIAVEKEHSKDSTSSKTTVSLAEKKQQNKELISYQSISFLSSTGEQQRKRRQSDDIEETGINFSEDNCRNKKVKTDLNVSDGSCGPSYPYRVKLTTEERASFSKKFMNIQNSFHVGHESTDSQSSQETLEDSRKGHSEVFGLLLTEDPRFSTHIRDEIEVIAKEALDVDENKMAFWLEVFKVKTIEKEMMPFLMFDIGQMLCSGKDCDIFHLLTDTGALDRHTSKYTYLLNLHKSMETSLVKATINNVFGRLRDYLQEAYDKSGTLQGSLLVVQGIHVLALSISSQIDPNWLMREAIQQALDKFFTCFYDTNLYALMTMPSEKQQQLEKSKILNFIMKEFEEDFVLHVHPKDSIFVTENSTFMKQLIEKLSVIPKDNKNCSNEVHCVLPFDPNIASYCCKKLFRELAWQKHIAGYRKIVAIVSLDREALLRPSDIIDPELAAKQEMLIFTVTNPEIKPVSCAIITNIPNSTV